MLIHNCQKRSFPVSIGLSSVGHRPREVILFLVACVRCVVALLTSKSLLRNIYICDCRGKLYNQFYVYRY
jgi:hypothetical protein